MRWVTLQNGDARRASRRWPQDAILLQVLVGVGSALGLMYQSLLLSAPRSCGAKAVVIVRLARSDSHPSMLPACVDVCLSTSVRTGWPALCSFTSPGAQQGRLWTRSGTVCSRLGPGCRGPSWPLGGLVLTRRWGGAQRDSGKLFGDDI